MVLLSACLGASADLEKWSSANLFNKIETTLAMAKTEKQETFGIGPSDKREITEETLQTFSVTDWGSFSYDEKMQFVQTAFAFFEVTGTTVLDHPETFVGLMDARYKEFLAQESGLHEHTDLAELSLFTEMESAGQRQGQLAVAEDH